MSLSALLSDERQIIDVILDAALGRGLLVSVHDGEEWVLAGSTAARTLRPMSARQVTQRCVFVIRQTATVCNVRALSVRSIWSTGTALT